LPQGLWRGGHQAERDDAEQRSVRATDRQLDADTRDVLDHARADLDQALADGCERIDNNLKLENGPDLAEGGGGDRGLLFGERTQE
jgi:hypothetical protein